MIRKIKIGAVWKRKKEEGDVYFTGSVDLPTSVILNPDMSIFLFKNRSEHEKSPAFDVFIAESGKKQDSNKSAEGDLEEF